MLGADAVEDREHVVVLDELPCLLDGQRHRVLVVEVLVDDLSPVDAAVVVDVAEVRVGADPDRAEERRAPRQRHGAADRDRRRGDARGAARERGLDRGERERPDEQALRHEIGFLSTGSASVASPITTRAPRSIGMSA